jgi:hypothetical protein
MIFALRNGYGDRSAPTPVLACVGAADGTVLMLAIDPAGVRQVGGR